MSARRGWVAFAAAAALVLLAAPAALAENKPVKPVKQWNGSVEDVALLKGAPTVVTSAKGFEGLWKAWKVEGKPPEVDFSKQLVVVTTTRGSRLQPRVAIDDNGDLRVAALSTKDLRPGFRYVIATVPREGVKTVNGKPLPKD